MSRGLLDCPACGGRMALEPDTRFCNACSRVVLEKAAPVGHQPAGATHGGGDPIQPSVPVREAVDHRGRGLVVIVLAVLAGCVARSAPVVVEARAAWILPLSAHDADEVCAITLDYPGRRCATAGDIRAYLRSIKAD